MNPENSYARERALNDCNKAYERGNSGWGQVHAITGVARAIVYLGDVMYKNGRHGDNNVN